MNTLIKFTLLVLAGLLLIGGLILLYPIVPGTSASPDPHFSHLDPVRTEAIIEYVEARDGIDTLLIGDAESIQLSFGPTHEPINTHSVRKPIINVLFGMAERAGKVDVNATLAEIGLDDAEMPLTDAEKRARISDLLKARSGIYIESAGETADMRNARPRRGQHPPDTKFYYNNWDFNTLGHILELTTGETLDVQMQQLAERLDFQDYEPDHLYYQESEGSEHDQYTLFLSARDLASVGRMMLRGGLDANGERLISTAWIEASTTPYSIVNYMHPFEHFGYLWRMDPRTNTWIAAGWGGQHLLVDPANDLIIVTRNHTGRRLGAILWRVILKLSATHRETDLLALRELVLAERALAIR